MFTSTFECVLKSACVLQGDAMSIIIGSDPFGRLRIDNFASASTCWSQAVALKDKTPFSIPSATPLRVNLVSSDLKRNGCGKCISSHKEALQERSPQMLKPSEGAKLQGSASCTQPAAASVLAVQLLRAGCCLPSLTVSILIRSTYLSGPFFSLYRD